MPGPQGKSKGSSKIQYVQNDEPSFIRQFKQRAGIKDPESVDSKFQERETDDREDREDEKPQVVIPDGSAVTEGEVEKFLDSEVAKSKDEKEETPPVSADGRILFRKPPPAGQNKRKLEESLSGGATASAADNGDSSVVATAGASSGDKKGKKIRKDPPKKSMLSFADEDEEDA